MMLFAPHQTAFLPGVSLCPPKGYTGNSFVDLTTARVEKSARGRRTKILRLSLICCAIGAVAAPAKGLAGPIGPYVPLPPIVLVADQGVTSNPAPATSENAEKPYTVKEGRVDPKTYEGWIRFSGFCQRCHGTGGVGSAVAPSLVESVKKLSLADFSSIVISGRSGSWGVMPTWGNNPNVVPYLDNIYAYLKARSDGALGPGRPEKLETTN